MYQDYSQRYINYIAYFTSSQKSDMYTNNFKRKVWKDSTEQIIAQQFNISSNFSRNDQALYTDINTYLAHDLLVKVDIATMSASLEGRSPFLDHEFMELAAQIPFHLKLKGINNKKYILKEALKKNLVPHEILNRKKQGFGIPIEDWFRKDLKSMNREILLSEKALSRKIFSRRAIKKLLYVHENTKINHAPRIWALLTLELWFREFLD
jgi:asparagine synthase (glutamine-hydrolysing)